MAKSRSHIDRIGANIHAITLIELDVVAPQCGTTGKGMHSISAITANVGIVNVLRVLKQMP